MKQQKIWISMLAGIVLFSGCVQQEDREHMSKPPAKEETPQSRVLTICAVQGAGHQSPFTGKSVELTGLVTGITYSKKQPNGFYLQDKTGDNNPVTSDGIYVFCGKNMPAPLKAGDEVSVSGTVEEYASANKYGYPYLTVTQITVNSKNAIKKISSGNKLPKPVIIEPSQLEKNVFDADLTTLDPEHEALDFYESLEGMRVQILNPKVIAEPHDGLYYIAPKNAHGFSVRGGLMYNSYQSTARICMQPKRCFASAADAGIKDAVPSIGDSYTGSVTGILSYANGNYQLEPTEPLPQLKRAGLQPERSTIQFDPAVLNLACYNLENFSVKDVKNGKGAVINHRSGKPSKERAKAFASHFLHDLKAPDVICLIEIQDDDSVEKSETVSSKKTLRLLLDSMKNLDNTVPYAACSIDPKKNSDGGAPGANIRCAYLYRTDRIELVPDSDNTTTNSTYKTAVRFMSGGKKMQQNPARIGTDTGIFKKTRKPLVAHFRYKQGINGGKDFFVINNHFSSKQADGKIWGGIQPVERKSEQGRHKQAQAVQAFISELRKQRKDAVVIAAGDYNDYWFSKTLAIMKTAGMNNAIEDLPPEDRYTYVFDGHSQTLDNILVTDNATIKTVDVLHINAEQQPNKRLSDHDPVFVQIAW